MELINETFVRKCELGSGVPLLVRAVEPEFSGEEKEKRCSEKMRAFYNSFYKTLTSAASRRLEAEEDESLPNTYCTARRLLDIRLDITYDDDKYISLLLTAKLVRGARRIGTYSAGLVWRKRDGKLCPSRLFDPRKPNFTSYILDERKNVVHID